MIKDTLEEIIQFLRSIGFKPKAKRTEFGFRVKANGKEIDIFSPYSFRVGSKKFVETYEVKKEFLKCY